MNRIAHNVGTAIVAIGCASIAKAAPAPAAFTVCTVCHKISADGANAVGPNLRGVVGRKAGHQPGYAYSVALKNSAFAWTPDKLDQWLAGPSKMLPGVKMAQTVASPSDRKAIIDYLNSLK